MLALVSPDDMAAADRAAVASGTPIDVLVDRAARAVARLALRMLGGGYGRRVVVVAGKGHNGADGIVAAAHLARRGVATEVFRLGDGNGDGDTAFDRTGLVRALDRAHLVVDAMYGTGFRGELQGDAVFAATQIASRTVPVLAVDIPSGVDGATGLVAGVAVRASATICFAALKPGLVFEPGRSHAGSVEIVDIGIDVGSPLVGVTTAADVTAWLPARSSVDHKWAAGLMIVAGSRGMTGAALMVGNAALRAGSGMVVLGLPGKGAAAAASGSELVVKALTATPDGGLDVHGAADALEDLGRFRALAVGPGLGREPATRIAVCTLVAEAAIPLVLDADGINALGGDFSLLRQRVVPAVLTPHEGEYGRMAGRGVGADRIEAACWLAYETRSIVLLKGPGTVVAAPDGRVAVNPTGGPWLATAGTGDVLTGIIGAFLARGVEPFQAAAAAAFVHGRAAREAPSLVGLVAGDLVAALPRTLAALGPIRP